MPLADKTRKILWGKSANRCAFCRQPLVVDRTESDAESVVGEECHIVSGAKNGPRSDAAFPKDNIDDVSNLLLLCCVHHKMIDDQCETYTAEILRAIKENHEKWVGEKLEGTNGPSQVRIRRLKGEIPEQLPAISSGRVLFNLASNCHGAYNHYCDDLSDEDVELVGGFFQSILDWIDLSDDLDPLQKLRAAKSIERELSDLRERDFLVFAALEKQRLEGGVGGPSNFNVLHLSVTRPDDPSVVSVEIDESSR